MDISWNRHGCIDWLECEFEEFVYTCTNTLDEFMHKQLDSCKYPCAECEF